VRFGVLLGGRGRARGCEWKEQFVAALNVGEGLNSFQNGMIFLWRGIFIARKESAIVLEGIEKQTQVRHTGGRTCQVILNHSRLMLRVQQSIQSERS